MFIDKALTDHSAEVARTILRRGMANISYILESLFGSSDFVYVACPDFSITLRQRRLVLGLPLGGYVNWSKYDFFPLELDVNSCGVHVLKLPEGFDELQFRRRLDEIHHKMDKLQFMVDGKVLKWNFSRRNHFIGIYRDGDGAQYMLFHSSGETVLFNWDDLHSRFRVQHVEIEGRRVPYIAGDDALEYWAVAQCENEFFFERHRRIFDELFNGDYDLVFADQHFGMVGKGEILMGCSKVPVGSEFPILTRPFETVYLARATEPPDDIVTAADGFALVPHGLGMTLPDNVVDIRPDVMNDECVCVIHENGSRMITDTLEYVGIGYRSASVVPQMAQLSGFEIINRLDPVLCLKL